MDDNNDDARGFLAEQPAIALSKAKAIDEKPHYLGHRDRLREQGIEVRVVPGWSHAATIWALRRICLQWQPELLLAHGFSEHIWGRLAGLWAGVPHMVHVEHNARERYTWLRLRLSRWLAQAHIAPSEAPLAAASWAAWATSSGASACM